MYVEDMILSGLCCGCDMDPAQCYLAGYCAYEEQENEDEDI